MNRWNASRPHHCPVDRRARRRQETIAEILDIALDVMTERRGQRPESGGSGAPAGSPAAVDLQVLRVDHGRLRRALPAGQVEHLEVLRSGMATGATGLDALDEGAWRRAAGGCSRTGPSPSSCSGARSRISHPSSEAFAPSLEMVRIQREALADAVAAGQLGPAADSDEAVFLVSILITGALTQAMANEPELPWGEGRFTPLFAAASWGIWRTSTLRSEPAVGPSPRPATCRGDDRPATGSPRSGAGGIPGRLPPADCREPERSIGLGATGTRPRTRGCR